MAEDGAAPSSGGWSVVVAEDDEDGAHLLGLALRRLGSGDVRLCGDATSCLECCRERLPDLVVTDIRMPDLDGYALIETLQNEYGARCPPVVVASANPPRPQPEPVVQCLLKPYTLTELYEAVRRALGSGYRIVAPTPRPR